jgi:tRNA C32,U32 (ribose-2'-O)-methylase TrmJ
LKSSKYTVLNISDAIAVSLYKDAVQTRFKQQLVADLIRYDKPQWARDLVQQNNQDTKKEYNSYAQLINKIYTDAEVFEKVLK